MSTVAVRDLRNHTADVLRRVADGDTVVVTQRGTPVAEIIAPRTTRQRALTRAQLIEILDRWQADPGLREDLTGLGEESTDDLGPIQ